MELLKEYNIELWKWIFDFFYPFTDNIPLIIILISGIFSIVFTLIRKKIFHSSYALGIMEIPLLLSIAHMVEQIPQIHNRIQLALRTTADIVMQSTEYVESFQMASHVQDISNASISRYLYYLTDTGGFSGVNPEQLYFHLFKTLGNTRGFFSFFEVHETSLVPITIFVMCIAVFIYYTNEKRVKNTICFLVQIPIFIYCLFLNNGTMLSVIVFFLIEQFFCEITKNNSCIPYET